MKILYSVKNKFLLLVVLLLIISIFSLLIGPVNQLWKEAGLSLIMDVMLRLRLPRLVAAWIVGSTLAILGLVSQRVFHNHLASPDILGISASASLGAFLSMKFFPTINPFFITFSFSLAILLPFFLLTRQIKNSSHLLLSGLAINAIIGGILAFLINISDNQTVSQYLFWSLGSLQMMSWRQLNYVLVPLIVLQIIFWRQHRSLDLLLFGDTWAFTRGLAIYRFRFVTALLMAIALSLTIAVAGPIGFIALIAPHITKLFFTHRYIILIPAVALTGAILLTISDAMGRLLFLPHEIKAGILLNILGGCYFIFLLLRRQHN